MKPLENMTTAEVIKHARQLKACKYPNLVIADVLSIQPVTLRKIFYGQNHLLTSEVLAEKLFSNHSIFL